MSVFKASTKYARLKHAFMLSLARDIVAFGGLAKVRLHKRKHHFAASIPRPAKESAVAQLKTIRNRRLILESKFICRMENRGIGDLFADGSKVCTDRIKPVIRICRTRKENDIFHYCRLLQVFPTAKLIGRQLRALVFDEGQGRPFLMGAIGLSSSPYSLACRERFLRWDLEDNNRIRDKGLDALMQLAVCMSWPPYSYLLCGKLMAALALSKTIASAYQFRYRKTLRRGTKLQGVITICAGGKHCPIFHRIMLRPGGLYRHVGETAGYTTSYFSGETMGLARRLMGSSNLPQDTAAFGKSMRTIKRALRLCDLPYEAIVKSGLRKGVYLGFASPNAIENLREGWTDRPPSALPECQIFRYWQSQLLPKRLCRVEINDQFQQFKAQRLLLGPQLSQ